MQISTLSSQSSQPPMREETACPLHCPLCGGALVLLHNSYRCTSCSYYLCTSCEASEQESEVQ